MDTKLILENCIFIQRKLKTLEKKLQHDPMGQLFVEEIAECVREIEKEVQKEPEHHQG